MTNRIWRWFGNDYRAHVTAEKYRVMMKWSGVQHGSVYTYPDSEHRYDIQFPKKQRRRVRTYLEEQSGPKKHQKAFTVPQRVSE